MMAGNVSLFMDSLLSLPGEEVRTYLSTAGLIGRNLDIMGHLRWP